jgi:threonine aldolase
MGGGMRQVGYIAAPCIVALDKMINRLKDDHENAKYLANKLKEIPAFEVVENKLDINMVFFKIKADEKIINKFNDNRFVNYLFKNNIKINHLHHGEYRFVTHYYITKEKINFTTNVIKKFIEGETLLLKNP